MVGPADGSREGDDKGLKDVDGLDDTEGSVEGDDETEGIEDLVGSADGSREGNSEVSATEEAPLRLPNNYLPDFAIYPLWCTPCI